MVIEVDVLRQGDKDKRWETLSHIHMINSIDFNQKPYETLYLHQHPHDAYDISENKSFGT